MSRVLLGVDVGGSTVRAALSRPHGELVAEDAASTDQRSAEAVLRQLSSLARRVVADAGVSWGALAAAGVGMPGVLDEDGALGMAPNLPEFDGVSLADSLADELQVPVTVDNDVNLAALGEHRRGLGAGRHDLAFLAVGTGVGLGVVVGGRLLRGSSAAAGEVAGLPLGGDPWQSAEPLEDVVGGRAAVRLYAERVATADGVTAREVAARAGAGDPAAIAVLDTQARTLALAVAAVHAILDPGLVVLGGGFGLRGGLAERLDGHLARLARPTPRMARSSLGERAGLIGALEAAADVARVTAAPVEAED